MLTRITDFSYRRNALEAMVFFLVYLVIILLVSALVSFLAERLMGDPDAAFWAGRFVAGLATTLLAIVLLKAKNLSASFGLVMLAFVSGIISLYISPLLGLLIPTYLSIR